MVYVAGGIVGGMILLFGAPLFIPWLLGSKYVASILPLQIMSFVPLMVALSNILGMKRCFHLEWKRFIVVFLFLHLL